ncbi:uncharacterized protein [Mytilus edulis]|uniref:uncharacterized protein n=1 Tax=Mytilus edulis TaxID=6550 RepID=UPI0039F0BEE2
MEPPNEKISFEKLNVGAFGNSSYNQAYSSPPECCGKQSDLNGYIQPINENGNRISSNHDYLIVQGSIKSNLSSNKEPGEPHSWLHSGENKKKGDHCGNNKEFSDLDNCPYSVIADSNKKEDHCGNNKEFSDLDNCPYSVIADSNKKGDHCGNNKEFSDLDNCPYSVIADSNIKQQEVKLNFPQIKYVEGPLNSPEKETEKALKSSRCSPGKIVAFVMITFIIMTGLGVGAYFLILRNISKELNCTDAVEADLYSGPVTIECTITKSEEFEYIGISHENGISSTIYGVSVDKNGTIFITFKENQDISINVESTSTLKLIITFINVTCTMDGSYKVALISNSSGEMNEIIGENVLLKIRSPTGKPTVTLSVDQVIDLVFPDGNYYRGSGIHTCEGLIGEPPAKLEIDITYNNGTSFEPISNSNIDLVSRTSIKYFG